MGYKIVIDQFEGPMDLLLHLIDRAEIDIYDIPINKISEQFLEHIKGMKELDLDIASEFLLMAATLLEIKSKMLLPEEEKAEKDQLETEEDPREELVRRIVEYKKYKEAANELKEYENIYSKMYLKTKEEIFLESDEEFELRGIGVEDLFKSFNKIMKEKSKKDTVLEIDQIQREEYTLKSCIERININLEASDELIFSELFDFEDTSKAEIIAYFLSILELIASKYIGVRQRKDFSDLYIFKLEKKESE